MGKKSKPRYRNLKAIVSACFEGQLSREEMDSILGAIEQGVGLSKRDKALGQALEQTDDDRDNPVWWSGYRAGLVDGYEGARRDVEAGVKLEAVADMMAAAKGEAS